MVGVCLFNNKHVCFSFISSISINKLGVQKIATKIFCSYSYKYFLILKKVATKNIFVKKCTKITNQKLVIIMRLIFYI